SLCGACQAACPVKINIPHMLIGLRELQHHERTSRWERLAYWLSRGGLRRPWLYRPGGGAGGPGVRPPVRRGGAPPPAGGGAAVAWTATRDFPAPAARPFRDRWPGLRRG